MLDITASEICDPLIVSQDASFLVRELYRNRIQVYHSYDCPPGTDLIRVPLMWLKLHTVGEYKGVLYGDEYEGLCNFFYDVYRIAASKNNNKFMMATFNNEVFAFHVDKEMYDEIAPVCNIG